LKVGRRTALDEGGFMQRFLDRHGDRILGVLCGFDRVLFRGTLLMISHLRGMNMFLSHHSILNKEFGQFAERVSNRVKAHAKRYADREGRSYIYVKSPKASKEEIARKIRDRDGIQDGLICVLGCVEPCRSFALRRDRPRKHLVLEQANRQCLFLYFYYQDREFGLIHVRLQTWLPMDIQVCLNGREYLARRLDRAGIGYEQRDNCFARIDDIPRAQRMLDDLYRRNWSRFLSRLAGRVNPWLRAAGGLRLDNYYWSIRESEVATDVMFRSAEDLAALYPALVDHAIRQFNSEKVLRFLGRRTNARFNGEVTSELKHRPEGICVKHRVEENSIKMYDKQGSVLRIETTINNPQRFKVRRGVTRQGEEVLRWVPLRKGVADIIRRAEICRAANERYLEALGVVGEPSPTRHLLDPVSKRIVRDGRPYRALRPIHPEEAKLFAALLDGKFLLQGFRNKDIRHTLYPQAEPRRQPRRQASARVTRLLRLLRAHGLIQKVSHTLYYRVTNRGQHVMTTALRLRQIDIAALAA
jgi:hypothetical protein